MSRDMNTQVRGYTEFYQGSIDPVEMEEILHRRIGDGPCAQSGRSVQLIAAGGLWLSPLLW